MKYFMKWREDFDEQSGEFSSKERLIKEIERIQSLIDDEDGEACIYEIIEGKEVTEEFI